MLLKALNKILYLSFLVIDLMKLRITKKGIKNFFTITIPIVLVMLVFLEIIFRTVIPAGHHPYFELYDEGGYVIGKYNHKNGVDGIKTFGAFARTKSYWKINNHGWNAAIDYQFEKVDSTTFRIAVIGDSYVEALNLDVDKSFVSNLNKSLNNIEVYSFGIGGSPMSQYMHFCRYVEKMYAPDAYIFVLANNDIDESWAQYGEFRNLVLSTNDLGNIIEHHPQYYEISQGKFTTLAKKSALVRYMFYNLQIYRIARLLRFHFNPDKLPKGVVKPKKVHSTKEMIKDVSTYIFEEIEKTTDQKQVLFVQDGDRANVYKLKPNDTKLMELVTVTKNLCDSLNYGYIYLFPIFERDFKQNKTRFNTAADYHWNEYAHSLIADTLSSYILREFNAIKQDTISN